MEEIEVKTKIFVTDDGERFNTLKSAQDHERHLEALEKLNSFKIDGPNYIPFDLYKCTTCNWQWYKVHDRNELEQILRLAAEVYAMENCSYDDDFKYIESRFYNNLNMTYYLMYRDTNSEQRRKLFPKYICISFDIEGINILNTLDNIEKQYEAEMKNWERFYQAFKNDIKENRES